MSSVTKQFGSFVMIGIIIAFVHYGMLIGLVELDLELDLELDQD